MKADKKSLQKFTKTEIKFNRLMSLEQITKKDIEILSKAENEKFIEFLDAKSKGLKGDEYDNFWNKIYPILTENIKNQLWEYNHSQIIWAISSLLKEYGRMPSKTQIATKTELSRQTVHKHLNEYSNHTLYLEQAEQFRFMNSKVLASVFQLAVNGDTSAAKLYLTFTGAMNGQPSNNTLIQNQNNFIQINGTVLSQETIKLLNPEQLNTIETILKTALPNNEINKP